MQAQTLPSLLQKAGYRTAVIGKWHLGLGDKEPDWNGELKPGPLEIGFYTGGKDAPFRDEENTLIVFYSDNGSTLDDGYEDGSIKELGAHEPSGPFTGGKYTVFEGGTRTPFITRWPGKIPAGVSDEIISAGSSR